MTESEVRDLGKDFELDAPLLSAIAELVKRAEQRATEKERERAADVLANFASGCNEAAWKLVLVAIAECIRSGESVPANASGTQHLNAQPGVGGPAPVEEE